MSVVSRSSFRASGMRPYSSSTYVSAAAAKRKTTTSRSTANARWEDRQLFRSGAVVRGGLSSMDFRYDEDDEHTTTTVLLYNACQNWRNIGLGLLLEIPSTPVSTPAYVSIFDVADEETQKFEKKFKEGNHVRVRILGFRHLEGHALGVLKASAFEGSVFTHSD